MHTIFFMTKKYILFIALLLLVGIIFRINYDYKQTQYIIQKEVQKIDEDISLLFHDHLKHLDKEYKSIAKNYQNNQRFINLIKKKDTWSLHKEFERDYESMKFFNPHLYVMHIFDTKNVTILRMHKPNSFNDDLTDLRPIVRDTNKLVKTHTGFEVGKNGVTYRITSPLLLADNTHLGTLEFGIELKYFMDEIVELIGGEAQLLVKTKNLNILNLKENRKQIGKFSLMNQSKMFDTLHSKINLKDKHQVIDIDDKTYVVFNQYSFQNHKKKKLDDSRIIFIKDITSIIDKQTESLFMLYSLNFMILFAAGIIFYNGVKARRKLTSNLEELNITLEEKVKQRTDEQNVLLSLFDTGESVLFKWKNTENLEIEYASLGVEELLGYTQSYIKENKLAYSSFIHQDDKERLEKEIKEASSSLKDYFKHSSYRIITKDNKVKWIMEYTVIVRDEKGNITDYVGHVSDITEQKNTERQLLVQARMAQMGEMISMIAHQWRQPLGSIAAISNNIILKFELESFDTSTQEGREIQENFILQELDNINMITQSLTHTIDDFRNFYKPDKKTAVLKLEDVVEKSLSIIKSSLVSDNIEIDTRYKGAIAINVFDNELMQVILNILKNAQDCFLEKEIENPKIIIDVESYVIKIYDNAGGIPEKIIDQIFDPYFSTKDEKNGTGLGLYMSKTIVHEHHGGTLSVQNNESGACFIINLEKVAISS